MKDNLINKAKQECGSSRKSSCVIVLKDVTKFKWDKLYLFPSWTTSDSITSKIGFEYTGDDVPDDYTRMLFTYRQKMAHEEDFRSLDYHSSTIELETAFDSLSSGKSYFITPSQAVFKVEKTKDKNACKDCYIYSFTFIKSK